MRRTGVVVVGFVVAVVTVLSGAVAVVLLNDDAVDAATLLERASAFVEAQPGVHFEGRLTMEFSDEEIDETVTTRSRLVGDTDFEDSRVIEGQGDFHYEVVSIGPMIYERSAESRRALESEKFAAFDLEEEARRSGVFSPGGSVTDPSRAGEPATLPELLAGATDPRVISTDGDLHVVRADVGRAAFEDMDTAGTAVLEVAVTEEGEVRRARIDVEVDDAKVIATYTFSRWGQPVTISPPPDDEIDPTPFIEEEDLAEWTGSPLFSPRALPRDWVLDGAYVVPEEETAEECEQVALDYTDPTDEEAGYLSLFQIPATCEGIDPTPPRGSAPFTAGRYSGWVDESEDGTFAQITVGSTVVQADTDLDIDELTAVLVSLAPLDLDARITPFGSGRASGSV